MARGCLEESTSCEAGTCGGWRKEERATESQQLALTEIKFSRDCIKPKFLAQDDYSLVPKPPPFFVPQFSFSIIQEYGSHFFPLFRFCVLY